MSSSAFSKVLAEARAIGVLKVGGWRVADAVNHLVKVEPRFEAYIAQTGLPKIYTEPVDEGVSHFASLVRAITSQQVSVAAGKSILDKVVTALRLKSHAELKPEDVRDAVWGVSMVDDKQKVTINGQVCGLSEAKAKYLRSLSSHFLEESYLKGLSLETLPEDVLLKKLLAVDGIGMWTAHMFLLFKLQRQNVSAVGDLGVRRGIAALLGIKDFKSLKEPAYAKLIEAWAPYSSLGCALMWMSDRVCMPAPSASKISTLPSSAQAHIAVKKSGSKRKAEGAADEAGKEGEGGEEGGRNLLKRARRRGQAADSCQE
jgi:DNA-3-methyladenine glycosylase II